MYRTKQHVDKHVANILGRVKDEKERNSRGYQVAKLYFEVREYEIAKRYLAGFLSVRENFAPAHKLLGQIYEGLQEVEKAITAYKRSLDLDDKQKDVLIKICELYTQSELDPERAKYWVERAEKVCPNNATVFKLKERIYTDKTAHGDNTDLESLITSELVKRPKDADLRAKLLRLYVDTGRVNEAYTHAVEVEKRDAYPHSTTWAEVLLDVFQVYREDSGNVNGVFHRCLLKVHSRLTELALDKGKLIDAADALYRFDQCLQRVCGSNVSGQEWEAFYTEMQAQFFLHAGNLTLKRAQQEHVSWTEASAMSAVCYLISNSLAPPSLQAAWVIKAADEDKLQYTSLHSAACYRVSQSGHLLRSLCIGDKGRWLAKIQAQWVTQQGRNKIYDTLFTLRHMKGTKDTSFLMTSDLYMTFTARVPSDLQLKEWNKVAHLEYPESLRHLVWIALHYQRSPNDIQVDYGFKVFADLQYETAVSLDRASPETLSQLDMQAFIYAVVRSTGQRLAQRHLVMKKSKDEPRLLPLCLHEELSTAEQAEWWQTAYLLHTNTAKDKLGRLRLVLQRGLETIRLTGNHGMPVSLIIHLAQVFSVRSEEAVSAASIVDHTHLQGRAAYYWTAAVEMLEKLAKNQCVRSPKKRMFDDHGPRLTDEEIHQYIEDGRFFLACQLMHSGKNAEAVEEFGKLNKAEASYHQAEIYCMMADEVDEPDDVDDSPQFLLLTKARDALYLTLDRIRGDRHHKLTTVLAPEIDEIEARLNRRQQTSLDPSVAAAVSEEEEEEETDAIPEPSTTILKGARSGPETSTPNRQSCSLRHRTSEVDSLHTRPSPERLDAQVRSLALSQDLLVRQLMDRSDDLMKQNKAINEELKQSRIVIEQLKTKLESYERMAPLMPPGMPQMGTLTSAMTPGVDCSMRPPPPMPPPPHAAASPYYGAYRLPEYDFGAHPQALPSPYSPHPHGYPMYAPLPPLHYGYPPPPLPPTGTQPPPPPQPMYQPPPQPQLVTGTPQEDEEDYYVYDDDDYENDDDDDDEEPVPTRTGRVHRTGGNSRAGGQFNVPDSQLVQDWPYGNTVNLEGKSTLTYSPSRPAPQTGYFSQIIPPPQGQTMTPPMYGSPVPPAIGPGYFSSPERPAGPYAQRFQSPTHLGLPPHQGVPLVGLAQPPALSPPKPGFLGTARVPPPATSVAAPGSAPPNAVLSMKGTMVPQGTGNSTPEAALTGGTIYKMSMPSGETPTTGATSSVAKSFGTQFIMTMPQSQPQGVKTPGSAETQSSTPRTSTFSFGLAGAGGSAAGRLYGSPAGKPPKSPGGPDEDEEDGAGDDSYQGPDFEPIIPLPDEVEVVTGEEDEKVLFKARTKLYRFVEKQWKERGLGELKILHNELTGRVRIVMRREQVHKVCANHALTPEMTVSLKSPNEKKLLTWQALDFTESQSQMEQFCSRFKNEDIAQQFKDKFEEGVAIAKKTTDNHMEKPVEKQEHKVKDSDKVKASKLLDKFKPKAGSWNCDVCMINNTAEAVKCLACTTPKPGAEQPKDDKPSESDSGPKITFGAAGGFSFGGVGFGSGSASTGEGNFSFGKPGQAQVPAQKTEGFSFNPPKAGGTAAATSTTTSTTTSTGGLFKFGSDAAQGSFKFGASSSTAAPTATVTSTASPASSGFKGTTAPISTTKTATTSEASPAPFKFTDADRTETFSFGNSTPVSTAKSVPTISAPKLNYTFSPSTPSATSTPTATSDNVTSTTDPPGKTSGFTFGSTTGVSTFKFGELSTPESSTPAANMLKSMAERSAANLSQADSTPKDLSKGTVGGFTFSSKPVLEKKEGPKQPEKTEETKPNPFAGFSFSPAAKTAPSGVNVDDESEKPVAGGTTDKTSTKDKKPDEPDAAKSDGSVGKPVPVFGQVKTSATPSPVFGAKADLKNMGADKASNSAGNTVAATDKDNSGSKAFGPTGTSTVDFASLAGKGPSAFSTKPEFKGFGGAGQAMFGSAEGASPSRGGDHEDGEAEEYEPDVDFKPVIPLPELVDVKTGEEEEEKLFGERAKLFRLDPAKQWKERGLGEMKILKHKETGRCRILMRREQVLKLCANHTITKDLRLQPLATSDRTWCWVAQDYTEGDLKVEQFACKFKTPDVAQMFKEVFEKAQASEVVQAPVAAPKKQPEKDSSKPSLAQMFALQKGEWECSVCMVRNKPNAETCLACETPNPAAKPSAKPQKSPQSKVSSTTTTGSGFDQSAFKFGSSSGFSFGSTKSSDGKASAVTTTTPFTPPQGIATPSKHSGGFNFGTPAQGFGDFKFGLAETPKKDATPAGSGSTTPSKATPSKATPSKADSTVSSSTTGYVFGKDTETPGFTFSGVTPSKPVDLSANKSPRSPGTGDDFYVNQEGEDSHIYFEPVVKLEKVDVKTGEEDEVILYGHRAKLYKFVGNEWKERGVGDIKILCHKETAKHRLLMRRDQVHKLCLNHYINGEMQLMPMANAAGKAWIWHADDFTEGEVEHQQFAIRFKTKDIADDFKNVFEDSVKQMANYSTPTKAKVDPSKKIAEGGSKVTKPDKKGSLSSMFAAKQGEWDCSVCMVRNKAELNSCAACQTPNPGAKPAAPTTTPADTTSPFATPKPAASNLGLFSFKLPTLTPDTSEKPGGFQFGQAGASGGKFSFGNSGFTGSVFGGSPSSSQSPVSSQSKEEESGKSPLNRGKSLLAAMLEQPMVDEVTSSTAGDDDVQIVGEKKATPKQVAKARKLLLPDHFYLYEEKPPCPGCRGCDDGEEKIAAKVTDDDVVYVGEDNPNSDQAARATRLQLPTHFYTYEDKPSCSGCPGCETDEAEYLTGDAMVPSDDGKTSPDSAQEDEPDSTTSTQESEGIFGAGKAVFGSGFSFAALAANSGGSFTFEQKKDVNKPFSWQGAGASLFQSPTQGGDGGDAETEDGVVQSHDVHFEPIVSLPEIELKTGEEDEEVLYSHRCRLYRFDDNINQWKERGIGEMKLLQHHENGKIRVLMRREQVLKLACNHMLSKEMKLLPLQTSETSWCWSAVDIALGSPINERFAIKFKDKTIAQEFKEKFEECQAMLSTEPELGGGDGLSDPKPSLEQDSAVSSSSGAQGGSEGQPEYRGEEEYEEEEEEDARPLFSKRVTLSYGDTADNWKAVGQGDLEVSYDDDVNGARITMTTTAGNTICNHIICQEYNVQCNEKQKFCEWTAKDFSTDDPVRRTFRAQFSSKMAVAEFRKIFQEGLELAADSEISEVPDHVLTFSREITIPEVVSMPKGDDDGGSQ